MAWSVELLTSAQAMISRTVSSSPTSSGSVLSAKSSLRIVCPPLSAPPLLALSLKTKQTNKTNKQKKPPKVYFPLGLHVSQSQVGGLCSTSRPVTQAGGGSAILNGTGCHQRGRTIRDSPVSPSSPRNDTGHCHSHVTAVTSHMGSV